MFILSKSTLLNMSLTTVKLLMTKADVTIINYLKKKISEITMFNFWNVLKGKCNFH